MLREALLCLRFTMFARGALAAVAAAGDNQVGWRVE